VDEWFEKERNEGRRSLTLKAANDGESRAENYDLLNLENNGGG
jgi:hypothetical protein